MRHLHSGRKLGRSPDHRRATLRSLTLALIENETITTIPSRAKELRFYAERAITLAKRGDLTGRRQLVKMLGSTQTFQTGENRVRNAIEKVYNNYLPRFKERHGGYTQIFRLATRRPGDNAEQCVMRYIPGPQDETTPKKAKKTTNEDNETGSNKS
jgi:large subunit ribosomal protein L17